MKMYVLDNGKMWIDKATLVAGHNMATADNQHQIADWSDIPIHTFLIDHPEGLVLFDTACDPEGMEKNWPDFMKKDSPYTVPENGYLPERLAQLNIKPEDIKYVVISHLHVDHAGCLKFFKNAKVFVNDEEFTRSLRQYALNDDLGAHMKTDIEGWLSAGLSWHPVEKNVKEIEILKGLTVLNFGPGHSWGMLGLLVELPQSGNFLLVADALYTSVNAGPPVKLPGILYDSLGYVSTAKFISQYAEKKNAIVLYGHDKEQFASLITSTEGCYE
jgi:N-acyl homoserine lactone hydrolase